MENNGMLKCLNGYSNIYHNELQKIPFQLNILDEIHANENSHSRILTTLLKVMYRGDYVFLNAFLNNIGGYFKNIKFFDATLYQEKYRIDILIIDKSGIAIIIENKIHGAIDQNHQIENYITKVKKLGISEDKIYILYLTKSGGSPSESSFSKVHRKKFGDRYKEINYKVHVLNSLEEFLPFCDNDKLLKSALVQYIDHLNGIFNKRITYDHMNKELDKYLHKSFGLDEDKDLEEKIDIINCKHDEISRLRESVDSIRTELIINLFEDWKCKIFSGASEDSLVSNYAKDSSYFYLGELFSYKGVEFLCGIGKDDSSKSFPYIGISVRGTSCETKHDEIVEFVTKLDISNSKVSPRWYLWRQVNYSNAIVELKKLLNEVKNNIQ